MWDCSNLFVTSLAISWGTDTSWGVNSHVKVAKSALMRFDFSSILISEQYISGILTKTLLHLFKHSTERIYSSVELVLNVRGIE